MTEPDVNTLAGPWAAAVNIAALDSELDGTSGIWIRGQVLLTRETGPFTLALVGPDPAGPDLAAFAHNHRLALTMLEGHLHDRIRVERAAGVSYPAIGKAFGVSRQAAWERFHNLDQETSR